MRRIILSLSLLLICATACAQGYRIRFTNDGIQYDNGTCFFVGDKIYTAWHVAEGNLRAEVLISGKWYRVGAVVRSCKNADTAVLCNTLGVKPMETKSIAVGPCNISASVKGKPVLLYRGKVIKLNHEVGSYLALVRQPQYACGASGSPVIQDGKIVGMAIAVYRPSVNGVPQESGVLVVPIEKVLGK